MALFYESSEILILQRDEFGCWCGFLGASHSNARLIIFVYKAESGFDEIHGKYNVEFFHKIHCCYDFT